MDGRSENRFDSSTLIKRAMPGRLVRLGVERPVDKGSMRADWAGSGGGAIEDLG